MSNITRREFIKKSIYLSTFAAFYLTGCGTGTSVENFDSSSQNNSNPNPNKDKSKVLVYLMLNGGNDSFNMLVPRTNTEYNNYATSRANLKIDKTDLLNLNDVSNQNNVQFGLHPSMPKVQNLFNSNKLSFIANSGPLINTTTKATYLAGTADIPLGLLSHADQRKHWQTLSPHKRTNTGIFGKLADQFQQNKNETDISMNISLGGTNIAQNGVNSKEYSITESGSIGLTVKETVTAITHPDADGYNNTIRTQMNELNSKLLSGFNNIIQKSYDDSFEKTFMDTTKNAQTHHEKFTAATNSIAVNNFTDYSTKSVHTNVQNSNEQTKYSTLDKKIGDQFKKIAQAIKASTTLGHTKQTFYIDYYGWDHHDELTNNHARMLSVIDDALGDFQEALENLGIDDKVITVVGSDFGRTLTSNGNGTDHAWGGNSIVMGKDIDGGKIFGQYPDLTLNSTLDVGGGVLIPTTSTDEIFAELIYWFGVDKSSFKSYIPNIENFYNLSSSSMPIGFIKS